MGHECSYKFCRLGCPSISHHRAIYANMRNYNSGKEQTRGKSPKINYEKYYEMFPDMKKGEKDEME